MSSLQKSRIFLYKLNCHSSDKPGAVICSGKKFLCGFHDMSFNSVIFASVFSSLKFFTKTLPGWSEVNQNWCIFEMPLRDIWIVWLSKKLLQSYVFICAVPSYSNQLGTVDISRSFDNFCNVMDTPHFCVAVKLLKLAKTPIWGELCVSH